jgi:molecular chaperone HscB
MTKVLHPDRYARADARARRASLQRSVILNQAWRVLRDPVKRAEHLLSLHGIEIGGEQGARRRDADGQERRIPAAQALLLEVMELREDLAGARATPGGHARDGGGAPPARMAEIAAEVEARRGRALATVAAGFRASPAPDLDTIAGSLIAIRYYDRLLEDVAAEEAAGVASPAEVAGHGG